MAEATPDLYTELGIDKDATPLDIQAAYRKRAKATHPDTGGSAEAFAATKLAFDILSDPDRRETYDETGHIQRDPSDAQILENSVHILDVLFSGLLDDQAPDPDQFDPLELMKVHLRQNVAQAADEIRGYQRKLKRAEKLARRIAPKTGAPSKVVGIMKQRIRGVKNQIAQKQFEETCLRRAIVILEEHRLTDHDGQEPSTNFRLTYPRGGFTSTI